jgi:hypothetical protein
MLQASGAADWELISSPCRGRVGNDTKGRPSCIDVPGALKDRVVLHTPIGCSSSCFVSDVTPRIAAVGKDEANGQRVDLLG